MRKCIMAFSLCVVLALKPFPAQSMYVSASELARACLSEKKEEVYACVFYIAGVIDYHTVMQSFGTAPTIDFCLPESITKEKAAILVMAYLKNAPQHDAFIAAPSIPMALHHVFPCKKTAPKRKK